MLPDATARGCDEEELRSVLLQLVIHREHLCSAAQAWPECLQQEKSNHRRRPEALLMMWQADDTATCVSVVCVCPSTPFLGLSCVHSTEYGSLHLLSLWRHFRILEQDGPLFGWVPLQYSALKKILKGSSVFQIIICLFCDFLPAPCLDLLQIRTC